MIKERINVFDIERGILDQLSNFKLSSKSLLRGIKVIHLSNYRVIKS